MGGLGLLDPGGGDIMGRSLARPGWKRVFKAFRQIWSGFGWVGGWAGGLTPLRGVMGGWVDF